MVFFIILSNIILLNTIQLFNLINLMIIYAYQIYIINESIYNILLNKI